MSLEISNLYKLIYDMKYDYNIEKNGYIILRKHQIIPKYYLYSTNNNVLILNYSTGSGKSLTGVFIILNKLYLAKINQFIPKYKINKAIVVGEWMTQNQFRNELSRPLFDFVNVKKISKMKNNEELKTNIHKTIDKYVNFFGYQSLFNMIFPYYYENNIQDLNTLISDYRNNKLQVKKEFLEKLKNTTIIVDEMQNLYSIKGLNTYGFTLAYLSRISRELNLKIVYLSGTIFNSSINEISSILNLIAHNKNFYQPQEFCNKIKLFDDIDIFKLKSGIKTELINKLSDNFFFYSNFNSGSNSLNSNSTEIKKYKDLKPSDVKHINLYKSKNIKTIKYYKSSNTLFPDEYIIGNTNISSNFCVLQLELHGYQLKTYKSTSINVLISDETENLSIYDAAIPTNNSEMKKHKIIKASNGLYEGDFLKYKNLINYSRIGYEIVNLCLSNSFNNEKTVIYHNKIQNFGLNQYGLILENNGFVKYGSEAKRYSICRNCGHILDKHPKSCRMFIPIYYYYLTGEQKEKERVFIVNNIYNSPNNLYGDLISVLLISDVAYSGVSLFNTNNLAIISRVSNISKIEQIQARIRRMKSHYGLPTSKRYVKYYIYGIYDNEDVYKTTPFYKYYKSRSESNDDINEFINSLIPKSIGDTLFNSPTKYKLTSNERKITSQMFYEDGREAIDKALYYLYKNSDINGWNLDMLVKRIKDSKNSISYIDFSIYPDSYIKLAIYQNQQLKIFKYSAFNDIYVKINDDISEKNMLLKTNEIGFNDIHADYDRVISKYIKDITHESSLIKKRVYYNRLLELLNTINDFSYLKDFEYIWKFTYIIHNEYYDNDEDKFILNHSSKNRNEKNVKGLYWFNKIILRNGKIKYIEYKFKEPMLYKNSNYSFRIISSYGLHLIIYNYSNIPKETDDNRYRIRGNDCWNYRDKNLLSLFKIPKSKNMLVSCDKLMIKLCDEQLNENNEFVLSPFYYK